MSVVGHFGDSKKYGHEAWGYCFVNFKEILWKCSFMTAIILKTTSELNLKFLL